MSRAAVQAACFTRSGGCRVLPERHAVSWWPTTAHLHVLGEAVVRSAIVDGGEGRIVHDHDLDKLLARMDGLGRVVRRGFVAAVAPVAAARRPCPPCRAPTALWLTCQLRACVICRFICLDSAWAEEARPGAETPLIAGWPFCVHGACVIARSLAASRQACKHRLQPLFNPQRTQGPAGLLATHLGNVQVSTSPLEAVDTCSGRQSPAQGALPCALRPLAGSSSVRSKLRT